jgi:hypothetical protein
MNDILNRLEVALINENECEALRGYCKQAAEEIKILRLLNKNLNNQNQKLQQRIARLEGLA